MAIVRKRSGRWQAMIRRSGHPPITKTFNTRSDCVKWSRQLEAQIERDLYLPNRSVPEASFTNRTGTPAAGHMVYTRQLDRGHPVADSRGGSDLLELLSHTSKKLLLLVWATVISNVSPSLFYTPADKIPEWLILVHQLLGQATEQIVLLVVGALHRGPRLI